MKFKNLLFFLVMLPFLVACSQDNDVLVSRNLQQFLDENNTIIEDGVTAFAANANANTNLVHIFYFPEEGATNVRYYELTDPSLDENNFANYRRQSLNSQTVFGGKLARFVRASALESYCLVTYFLDGELKISSPIKLQSQSKTTTYSDNVVINYKTRIEPNFTWEESSSADHERYFQVISNEENNFLSGTFTKETFFQFYDEDNVTTTINTETPKALEEDEVYNFTMMDIGKDNWVTNIIEEQFIPRNLEEFVAFNQEKTLADLFAFAASANGNIENTYIYYLPITDAFDFRYYETENTAVDKNDFSNYRRKNLSSSPRLGNRFGRFTNNTSKEVWCVVTFSTPDNLHISAPIKTQNLSKATKWTTDVLINYPNPESLSPIFTWMDERAAETERYLQIFTTDSNAFLSGTFTQEQTFQYYNEANITIDDNIHTETPPDLILDNEYNFSLFGLNADNWTNLIIQKTFIAAQ
ncbi:hypothetical protein [uncultured Polaribacter sp.]|uniref:hypothetical protein n=1 Tax=uncultured Polaribacter sp. TaxID=174711 RepID=UPI002629C9DA|nr:hypothetical protein [uncultured Polaribacter sp.]